MNVRISYRSNLISNKYTFSFCISEITFGKLKKLDFFVNFQRKILFQLSEMAKLDLERVR